MTDTEKWEVKRLYIGEPVDPYAQDQLNRAGQEGWELVQIMEFDAWMKRRVGQ